MSEHEASVAEDAEMVEADGEKVVTMMDVLQEQQDFEDDANAVLGASDEKECTYSKGYIKRQAVYACLTCCEDARDNPEKRAGVCLACSLNCHENHDLIELYTKRNFRCDCGNPKFNSKCQFLSEKPDLNTDNIYNQNFSGLYCTCRRPYPDPEAEFEDEMIQCIVCEDWLHSLHLEAQVPPIDQYAEMICKACMDKNEFLHCYSEFAVNVENGHVDVENCDSASDILNGTSITNVSALNSTSDLINKTNEDCIEENSEMVEDKTVVDEGKDTSEPDEGIDTSEAVAAIEDQENDVASKETIEKLTEEAPEQTNKSQEEESDNSLVGKPENLIENGSDVNESESNKLVASENDNLVDNGATDITEAEKTDGKDIENTETPTITNSDAPEQTKENVEENAILNEPEANDIENNIKAIDSDLEKENNKCNGSDSKEINGGLETTKADGDNIEHCTSESINDEIVDESPVVDNKIEAENTDNSVPVTSKSIIDETSKTVDESPVVEETEDMVVNTDAATADEIEKDSVKDVEMNEIVEPSNMELESSLAKATNGIQENESKRKLLTEETDEINSPVKKPKLDSDPNCTKPKFNKKVYEGATFWPSNFRQKLCTCTQCMIVYKDMSVLYLIDSEDTVSYYEALGKERSNGTPTQYEQGLEALSSLDRVHQINALTEYNRMRDKLLDFLKSFKEKKEVVKEEDIKAFFAGMKPKREPDGVYFCR